MNPELVFRVANTLALCGWILLAIAPRRAWASRLAGLFIPLLLGLLYASLIALQLGRDGGGFSTLAQVAQLFKNPWLLLAGWVHYLAFDLFIGAWETRDAARNAVPRWALVPCLFLTFMLGPIGLICYFAARALFGQTLAAPAGAAPS